MSLLTRRRYFLMLLAFFLLAALCVLLAPLFGPEKIAFSQALKAWWGGGDLDPQTTRQVEILIRLRFPRVVMAFLAGAALALTGAVFQALLRNPLADPYTLGVASGASVGAALAFNIPALYLEWGIFSSIQVSSLIGATIVTIVIYRVARSRAGLSSITLLLVGVTIGFICAAAIMIVRYTATPGRLVEVDRWLMGGLDVTGWRSVQSTLPLLVPFSLLLLFQARHYDQIAFGEELASARGCPVRRLRNISFFGGSILTASVVSVVGPIGFVGLIVPHALRRLIGSDHRLLLPASFFGGGMFLVICDSFARSISWQPPVGILTALLGGPFFLVLLVRSREKM